jgi:hypothetical protein
VFEQRRPATPAEIDALLASFDVINPPLVLYEAEISEIATLDGLGAASTVLAVPDPPPGGPSFYTVAAVARSWEAGGGTEHDQQSFQRALRQAEDPAFAPEVLFEPTTSTPSGWRIVDAIHRAAALLTRRTAGGITQIHLRVFVLPRPL